jgi:hypothetical protein
MSAQQWHNAWVGTLITLGVAAGFAWLSAVAISGSVLAPPPAARRRD